jgi:hypothetical protein
MKITKKSLIKLIEEEITKTLSEQGSFTSSGPDTDWALTVGQIGAMKASGKKDVLASLSRNIDLKGVLMNATQGSHPDFLDLLELPEFQEDSRVKEHGY